MAILAAGPKTHSSQFKKRGIYYKDRVWLMEFKDRQSGLRVALEARKPPQRWQLSSVFLRRRTDILFSLHISGLQSAVSQGSLVSAPSLPCSPESDPSFSVGMSNCPTVSRSSFRFQKENLIGSTHQPADSRAISSAQTW